ncbi:FAD-dependent monooxygenase [Nocardia huaxiensis]|uniref:FAD-dependent monooxygenase n=1 Tax=Nocardia huaxiensis TaxID=2755382 RepID=A0A7D6V8I0_9NOCA|nr:FAD-dependent monooxygenase [Nocardia huaxiensis]QLY29334.1 FAD-dependent monooxygenase [Nocardia huaxiensis]UFS97189.1 FAD-dependent monooxygenase [Nocardia huaxiensis]
MIGNAVPTEVLIAGGGSVGLMLAVLLRHHGVEPLVVEERPGLSPHPRANGIGLRTVEILREVGLEDAVNEAAVDLRAGKIRGRTLAEADYTEGVAWKAASTTDITYTPARIRGTCAQNRFDRVLITRAGDVEFGVALENFEQDPDGVTATLSDGRVVRARYLVAADGVRSRVRDILGIGLTGPGAMGRETTSILFDADLRPRKPFAMCNIEHPDATGLLVTVDGESEWVFLTAGDADPTPELLRTALGDPSIDVKIRSVQRFRGRGQVADRLSEGRVFLIGDAAHVIPPLGAFGLNTGIADAHNLAWKLAHVLRGAAGPELLDTYHTERHPVAMMTMEQARLRFENPSLHWGEDMAQARRAAGAINAPVVHMGYRYGGAQLPSTEDVTLDLDGSPGSRLPHMWVADGVSTLDLVGSQWCILTADPVVRAEFPVHVVNGWPYGTVLVRPDGFVSSTYDG